MCRQGRAFKIALVIVFLCVCDRGLCRVSGDLRDHVDVNPLDLMEIQGGGGGLEAGRRMAKPVADTEGVKQRVVECVRVSVMQSQVTGSLQTSVWPHQRNAFLVVPWDHWTQACFKKGAMGSGLRSEGLCTKHGQKICSLYKI